MHSLSPTQVTTATVLAIVTLALIVWDVFLEVRKGNDATITVTLQTLGRRYLLIPFAFGLLMGHLFFCNC